jgi:hypothetical protein
MCFFEEIKFYVLFKRWDFVDKKAGKMNAARQNMLKLIYFFLRSEIICQNRKPSTAIELTAN